MEVRCVSLPLSAVTLTHQAGQSRIPNDKVVRAAFTVLLPFVVLYLRAAVVALPYGDPFHLEVVESPSAAASVGLSVGVLVHINDILQMWLGRLRFIAVLAYIRPVISAFRGHA